MYMGRKRSFPVVSLIEENRSKLLYFSTGSPDTKIYHGPDHEDLDQSIMRASRLY